MIADSIPSSLLDELNACFPGVRDHEKYELLCEKILKFLFVPPLEGPLTQLRGGGGVKDLVLFIPYDAPVFWQNIHRDYNSSLVIVECKNVTKPIDKTHLSQLSDYLGGTHGLFGIMLCRKQSESAKNHAKWLLIQQRKLILCIDDTCVIEMIRLKQSGYQPERVLDILRRDLLISV
jgi:hypothetical protein